MNDDSCEDYICGSNGRRHKHERKVEFIPKTKAKTYRTTPSSNFDRSARLGINRRSVRITCLDRWLPSAIVSPCIDFPLVSRVCTPIALSGRFSSRCSASFCDAHPRVGVEPTLLSENFLAEARGWFLYGRVSTSYRWETMLRCFFCGLRMIFIARKESGY
jgi:hypothetical protein